MIQNLKFYQREISPIIARPLYVIISLLAALLTSVLLIFICLHAPGGGAGMIVICGVLFLGSFVLFPVTYFLLLSRPRPIPGENRTIFPILTLFLGGFLALIVGPFLLTMALALLEFALLSLHLQTLQIVIDQLFLPLLIILYIFLIILFSYVGWRFGKRFKVVERKEI